MDSDQKKHILVAVLDWGLGHATRCVPVIRMLLSNQCRVSIAGNGSSLTLLKQEFSQLTFYDLPSYKVNYPSHGFFFFSLLMQSPRIFSAIRKEHRLLEQLIVEHGFDAIISDNRYGCYSQKVQSVFITHQLNIQLPRSLSWSKRLVDYVNHRFIKRFSICWVPDFEDSKLTGILTRANGLSVRFIGLLSRFTQTEVTTEKGLIVALVSGPEPQREVFDHLLLSELKGLNQKSLLLRGRPHMAPVESIDGSVTIMNHASAGPMQLIISKADIIIARSGYSTVMDLVTLGKRQVIFIPTPGQTEQEYLARKFEQDGIAHAASQSKLDLQSAIKKLKDYHGFESNRQRTNLLDEALNELLQQI